MRCIVVSQGRQCRQDHYLHKEFKKTLFDIFQRVLLDERLAQSEAVYVFFSPSPEHLKQPSDGLKTKGKFSLANMFKR